MKKTRFSETKIVSILKKQESGLNLELMRLMEQHYLDHPFKGARRMHIWLTKDKGYLSYQLGYDHFAVFILYFPYININKSTLIIFWQGLSKTMIFLN